jgi:hypothetical protein
LINGTLLARVGLINCNCDLNLRISWRDWDITNRVPKKVTNIRHPSGEWALTDCDLQLLTGLGITSATYMNYIAKEPVHGSKRPALRNYMYFDWSVRARKTPF